MRRWMVGAAVAALLLAMAGLGGAGWWFWHTLHAQVPLPVGGAVVSVASGEPFRTTCERLEAAGVIRHGWVLRLWGRWQGTDRLVRSGDYRFAGSLSPVDVLAALRSPTAALHTVTIPEGSTVKEVAGLLASAGFGTPQEFLCLARDAHFLARMGVPRTGLEGYLFPDTYAFTWETPAEEILSTMVERFNEQVAPLHAARLQADISETDMVTLAAIIEKETGAPEERSLVSAVFHNRLRIGMPLQSDPTAVYGREAPSKPTAADLTVASPYNTYLNRGLPPGPICNPSRASLEAAIAPAEVPYLYFVSRNDGTHAFSRTLDEHNRAVMRFQRGSGRRQP